MAALLSAKGEMDFKDSLRKLVWARGTSVTGINPV